ncbi:MAG: hypothetical protein ACKVQU_01005, partial [Burkholderiales bacterium]
PHVPHGWESGLMMELNTRTLLCGDLFTEGGPGTTPVTESDIIEPIVTTTTGTHMNTMSLQSDPLVSFAALGMALVAALQREAPISAVSPVEGAPTRVRFYPRDASVFIDDDYVIRGVAGAVLRKLIREARDHGRTDFTLRELCLAGSELRLPDLQDNLSARLLLLERRLKERGSPIRIERATRGRIRLKLDRPVISEDASEFVERSVTSP